MTSICFFKIAYVFIWNQLQTSNVWCRWLRGTCDLYGWCICVMLVTCVCTAWFTSSCKPTQIYMHILTYICIMWYTVHVSKPCCIYAMVDLEVTRTSGLWLIILPQQSVFMYIYVYIVSCPILILNYFIINKY